MTRNPGTYQGAGEAVHGDVHDPTSLRAALGGCDAAYYLVHSLDAADFETRDADAARSPSPTRPPTPAWPGSSTSAGSATRTTISPRTCAAAVRSRISLGSRGVPVTTLRAGIIVGYGGVSWEMTRQLVEHLPAMVCPRWVRTRTQPIAVADVIRYLVGVLDRRPRRPAARSTSAAPRSWPTST